MSAPLEIRCEIECGVIADPLQAQNTEQTVTSSAAVQRRLRSVLDEPRNEETSVIRIMTPALHLRVEQTTASHQRLRRDAERVGSQAAYDRLTECEGGF